MLCVCWEHLLIDHCQLPTFDQDMSTLIKSGTLWFSDFHSRWLTSLEALTCQGFPINRSMSYGTVCCSFAARAEGLCSQPKSGRSAVIGQAGNSMHTEVSTCIVSFALLEIKLEKCARSLFKVALQRNLHCADVTGPVAHCGEKEDANSSQGRMVVLLDDDHDDRNPDAVLPNDIS